MMKKFFSTRVVTAIYLIAGYALLLWGIAQRSGVTYDAALVTFYLIASWALYELSCLAKKLFPKIPVFAFLLVLLPILFDSVFISLVLGVVLGLILGREQIVYSSRFFSFFMPAIALSLGLYYFLELLSFAYVEIVIWLTVIVASSDTGAYYVGKSFGKRKLSTAISPNKTLEGTFGGLFFSALVAYLTYDSLSLGMYGSGKFILIALVVIAAPFGDLLESYLKRLVGVKDSSNILPGHGGLLDRIDALMFTSLAFYLVYFN